MVKTIDLVNCPRSERSSRIVKDVDFALTCVSHSLALSFTIQFHGSESSRIVLKKRFKKGKLIENREKTVCLSLIGLYANIAMLLFT